jgi:hypothetical protein
MVLSMAIEEKVVESLCGEEGDYNGIWDMWQFRNQLIFIWKFCHAKFR